MRAATIRLEDDAEVDDAARDLGIGLRDLNRSMRLLRQHRSDHRPPVPAGLVSMLMYVDELAGCGNGRELAARTGLDPSTVSGAVAALVADGLVERNADPADGRAGVLALTAAGRAALADALAWYGDVIGRALAGWTRDEVAALGAALRRFTADVGRTLGHPDPLEAAR